MIRPAAVKQSRRQLGTLPSINEPVVLGKIQAFLITLLSISADLTPLASKFNHLYLEKLSFLIGENPLFVHNFSPRHAPGREAMGVPSDPKKRTLPSRDPRLENATDAISSLNEAWVPSLFVLEFL